MNKLIKKVAAYNRAYIIVMNQLQKDFEIINRIMDDYYISVLPDTIFIGGKEVTKEELQRFITDKRKDYGHT